MRKPNARSLVITNALLGILAVAMLINPIFAGATHQPADKVVATGSKVEVVEPTGTTLLSTEFRTSSPTDLMMHVTLECSIITEVLTQGGPDVAESTGQAEGRIRAWLEFDGQIVPINSASGNPQPGTPSPIGDDSDKVTFCNREHRQTLTDTEDGEDGTDTLRTYLRTKAANAFNWVFLNTGNGIHTVELKAEYDEPLAASEGSMASGLVGNRTLIVEPTKMSNHASV
jgi:hypothetical protein